MKPFPCWLIFILTVSSQSLAAAAQLISQPQSGSEPRYWANGNSAVMDISSNGVRVVFLSDASNLVTNDLNSFVDVFVRDRSVNQTILVSVNASWLKAGNAPSTAPVISADGAVVAFQSVATDLWPL